VNETSEMLTIGEISVAEDNKSLADHGLEYPRYRYVMTISKKNILDRQDFEIKETNRREFSEDSQEKV